RESPVIPTVLPGILGVGMDDAHGSQLRVQLPVDRNEEVLGAAVNRDGHLAVLETVHLIDDREFVPAFGMRLNGTEAFLGVPVLRECPHPRVSRADVHAAAHRRRGTEYVL